MAERGRADRVPKRSSLEDLLGKIMTRMSQRETSEKYGRVRSAENLHDAWHLLPTGAAVELSFE
jgi:hypothetical protein